jgi:DNA-binding response OmpR family regulator
MQTRAAPTQSGTATVLVIEDDPTIREVLSYHLARAGHEVVTAADGVAALQALRAHEPDLVLLDLMLPRMAGLDVLRQLRYEHATPVIIVSARAEEAEKIAGLNTGADDYVTKPFSVAELMARVQAALRRSAVRGTEVTAVDVGGGVIEVDAERHEVRRRGELVHLTPKEFELLAFLLRHANRVCSRDAILNAVWGYGYEGDTRTVDVHMHWLRQKLEDDPAHPEHLVTVRNYGYKFLPRPSSGA